MLERPVRDAQAALLASPPEMHALFACWDCGLRSFDAGWRVPRCNAVCQDTHLLQHKPALLWREIHASAATQLCLSPLGAFIRSSPSGVCVCGGGGGGGAQEFHFIFHTSCDCPDSAGRGCWPKARELTS